MKKQRTNRSNRKTQTNRNSFSGRGNNIFSNRKLSTIVSVAILVVGLFAVAVMNIPGLNPFQTHAIAPARLCTLSDSNTLCLNRKGGGTALGTPIIGWYNQSDNHDNFRFVTMPYLCGTGHVRDYNPAVSGDVGCPFTTKTLNHGNRGRLIVKLEESGIVNPALCVADTTNPLDGSANLGWCPDAYGHGGSPATMFVAMQTTQTDSSLVHGTQLVNVRWSDEPAGGFGIQGRYLCLEKNGAPAWLTWNPTQVSQIGTMCYFKQTNYFITM